MIFRTRKRLLLRRRGELAAKDLLGPQSVLPDSPSSNRSGSTVETSHLDEEANSIVVNPIVGQEGRDDSITVVMAKPSVSSRNTMTSQLSTRTTMQNLTITRRTFVARSSVGILSDSIIMRNVESAPGMIGEDEIRVQCIEEFNEASVPRSRNFTSMSPSEILDNL
ncbi:hypothetical protein EON65_03930 [archaeon]|nr:MAG: hypothetical protein EON65_03930 [archaeon]